MAVVGHSYWKRHGADPAIIGQTVKVNGRAFEIVGVAPEGFSGTSVLLSPDLFVPLGVHEWLRTAPTMGLTSARGFGSIAPHSEHYDRFNRQL